MKAHSTETPANSEAKPKIVVSFSMMPGKKRELQAYLDANFEKLRAGDPDAKKGLQDAIRNTFPREDDEGHKVGSLEEFGKIIRGESQYALLVKNCPEREGLEHQKAESKAEDTYSYFIGNALYEMSGAQHAHTVPFFRKSHNEPKKIEGSGIHRDCLKNVSISESSKPVRTRYIILSSPYNGEHAATQLIDLQAAIASLPKDTQKKVSITFTDKQGASKDIVHCTLKELLHRLRGPRQTEYSRIVHTVAPDTSRSVVDLIPDFLQAVEQHSAKVDLQPGSIMAWNEDMLFHRACAGDDEKIAAIPKNQAWSRILFHNAGARATGR